METMPAPPDVGRHLPWAAMVGAARAFRFGQGDPTTVVLPTEVWRATHTPEGPATARAAWGRDDAGHDVPSVEAWGPGAAWLVERMPAMLGLSDHPTPFTAAHPAVMRAQANHPFHRLGASGDLYHELLPIVLGQRITAGEAIRQWHRLCAELGDPAPGPAPPGRGPLRLPPQPSVLARTPSWWFHPLGIERTRAETLIEIARHAGRLWEWSSLPAAECASRLVRLRGVGEWTIGLTLSLAYGEPDSIAVGDYHLKNIVVHALTGRPRGTDDEMVELLAPYRPQRGRVVRLLIADRHIAPRFGPGKRVLPMHRW